MNTTAKEIFSSFFEEEQDEVAFRLAHKVTSRKSKIISTVSVTGKEGQLNSYDYMPCYITISPTEGLMAWAVDGEVVVEVFGDLQDGVEVKATRHLYEEKDMKSLIEEPDRAKAKAFAKIVIDNYKAKQ